MKLFYFFKLVRHCVGEVPMFNTGWKTRGVLLFLFLSFFTSSALSIDYPVLNVYRIDNGQDLTHLLLKTGENGFKLELFD